MIEALPGLLTSPERTRDPDGYPPMWERARAAVDGPGDTDLVREVLASLPDAMADPGAPSYVGYVPNAASPLARSVDAHLSVLNAVAAGSVDGQGCVVVEAAAADKVAELAGLPAHTRGGTFVQGGTLANFCALAAARDRARQRQGGRPGVDRPHVVVTSAAVHTSVRVAARLLDLDIVTLPVGADGAVDTDEAQRRAAAADLDGQVVCVLATAGTTTAGAVDDLEVMAAIAARHDAWFHVDGAYGAAVLFSRTRRDLLAGIERCDSFVVDPHKFLFCPFDSSLLIYRDAAEVSELGTFSQVRDESAAYLDFGRRHGAHDTAPPAAALEPGELSLQLSRRARGVVLWALMAGIGVDEIGRRVDSAIDAVGDAARYARARGVAVPVEPRLSVLLLGNDRWPTIGDWDSNWVRPAFEAGYFVSTDVWSGIPVGRVCVVNPDPAPIDPLVDLIAMA